MPTSTPPATPASTAPLQEYVEATCALERELMEAETVGDFTSASPILRKLAMRQPPAELGEFHAAQMELFQHLESLLEAHEPDTGINLAVGLTHEGEQLVALHNARDAAFQQLTPSIQGLFADDWCARFLDGTLVPTATPRPEGVRDVSVVEYVELLGKVCAEVAEVGPGDPNAEVELEVLVEIAVSMEDAHLALSQVSPPPALADYHAVFRAIWALSLAIAEYGIDLEKDPDSEDRGFAASVYLQMKDLGIAAESVWRELNPETQQMLLETGCALGENVTDDERGAVPTATPRPTPTPTSTLPPTPTPTPFPVPPDYRAPTQYDTLSAGSGYACALRTDGSAVCWGRSFDGEASPPTHERFSSISAGYIHTCALLLSDGHALCWGNNRAGQTASPPEVFVSISAGVFHTCGLRPDGSAVCWGGQDGEKLSPPPGERFTAISSGEGYTCGLLHDGSARCWGIDEGAVSPPKGERFTAISVGSQHTCGLRPDGSVSCWGDLGAASEPEGERFTAISVGSQHTCGLRADGSPVCWGDYSTYGVLEPPPGQTLVSIDSGGGYNCGLRADGRVLCWGGLEDGLPPDDLFATKGVE